MSFANPLPWWALTLIAAAALAIAWLAYSRAPLSTTRRAALSGLRFVTLLALVIFLLRPVARIPDTDARSTIVPILVDTSRSMSIEDAAHGGRRIDAVRAIVTRQLVPLLSKGFQVEVLGFGESVAPVVPGELSASARRSELGAALAAVRDRYRGRVMPGIVLLSDGGDTGGQGEQVADGIGPVFAIGVGGTAIRDSEVLSVTAAEQVLDDSRLELAVSAVAHGAGTSPLELRLRENGRPVDVKRVTPAADGTPVRQVFQVSPPRGTPTVYTVEIPAASGEMVPENNSRSVLVQPPVRARRVLVIEGAPGFEHSFLKRAWATDQGLEVDSIVRKGRDDQGADTYYIQAARSRSAFLTGGFPASREALFGYDAVVLANVEAHQLTRVQLEAVRAFVAQRGGGLLVLGARSFLRQGLADTALDEVLPLDATDRGGDAVPASAPKEPNRVALTAAGESHPIMQLSPDIDDTRRRWDALPALASVAPLGGPRPGASVLAVTTAAGGTPRAVVAVQRFGEGRAMVFTGEASWRWRMMVPATDRAYDTFWKQSLRWLALGAADPVQLTTAPGSAPGDPLLVRITARSPAFAPIGDASVDVRITAPDGRTEPLTAVADSAGEVAGRYAGAFRPTTAGVYKIAADVRQGNAAVGAASTSVLVGGADVEMTDPRLNLQLLQRLAALSGGRVLTEDQLGELPDMLRASLPAAALAVRRDLWHNGWSFAAILVLLAAEWILRRRWGLR
ncbi:MAG TPA: glutamine amidotransferase [Vicinamibacterales bacterium]|nr:glutamine amidotransferase [Vicinamibacterales bacterium]